MKHYVIETIVVTAEDHARQAAANRHASPAPPSTYDCDPIDLRMGWPLARESHPPIVMEEGVDNDR